MADQPPLVICMENALGEEVSLEIGPQDDFQSFLDKAKNLLGYDVDINSITKDQPVSLTDNIYQFLMNSDQNLTIETENFNKDFERLLPPENASDDLIYILDDGTQIRASQIQFDNEDPLIDLSLEKLPFVKYVDDGTDENYENQEYEETRTYNIIASPVSSKNISSKSSFANTLPFKFVCSNTSSFEAQFTKFLEANALKSYPFSNTSNPKSPRSLIKDSYKYHENLPGRKKPDSFSYRAREEILNMFRDSPVASMPYESFAEKRRHVRKSDPTRPYKNWAPKPVIDINGEIVGDSGSKNCFICNKYVESGMEKSYLFDKEDQRLHRSSPQKKSSAQLKIICEPCLEENFRMCPMKSLNQSLNPDEYLIIKNNQQFVFRKVDTFNYETALSASYSGQRDTIIDNCASFATKDKGEFVKVEIGSDGEIVTKPIDCDVKSDDVIVVKDEDNEESSSDVEIIENEPDIDDTIIDNLDDADEDVIEFLGKYQCGNNEIKELKCRFCEREFSNLSEVIDHGETHKHILDEGEVYPCPLCDYGYANFKWLKGHLKAAHEKVATSNDTENQNDKNVYNPNDDTVEDVQKGSKESPIARRTRSASKKGTDDIKTEVDSEEPNENNSNTNKDSEEATTNLETSNSKFIIKTEVKQECVESSDDEIWIVQTADDEGEQQLQQILDAAKKESKSGHRCAACGHSYVSAMALASHRCRRRPVKRRPDTSDERSIKKQAKMLNTSDSQVVTCHNCNESFTSKVRLKFHMQFHDTTNLLTSDGRYKCTECESTTFATETELFDHVHFSHKHKRWHCTVDGCGKTFYLRATLTKHSRTHTDTRRYACSTCGKRFLDKQTLDEHGVTHLQTKPFKCHICLKQLTRRSRLRMHLRAHEEELCPKLVLVCAVCHRAFRDPQHLLEHVRRSPECIEEFANEVKQENETVTVQLSPTSGLVRHTVQVIESPKVCKRIRFEAEGPLAEALVSQVAEEARAVARVVEIEKAFRCEYCEDVFYSEDGLNNHRVIHKGVKNPFTCHICKVSFATYSRCTTHKTTHGFYKRSVADAKQAGGKHTASSAGVLGYGDFPVVKHFLCEDCGRSYLHWTYLQVHRRMKHTMENSKLKCSQCDRTFANTWSVLYHRKKAHCPHTATSASYQYKFPCRDCDTILPNKTALYKHRKKEHSDMAVTINDDDEEMSYYCEVCAVGCGSGAAWAMHAAHTHPTHNTHTTHTSHTHTTHASTSHLPHTATTHTTHATHSAIPPPRRACPKCGHSFPDHAELARHLREIHNQTEEFSCEICKAAFQTHAELSAHNRTHVPVKPYACPVCGHGFKTVAIRNEHMRIHSGERPFPCDVCGIAFRRSTAMRNHRVMHAGGRAWACGVCPRRFRARTHLRTHLRLKHPACLTLIEVAGMNPSPEEIMEHLKINNIPREKVLEISKISFAKGTTSIIPSSSRALSLLRDVPRTQIACSRTRPHPAFEVFQPSRRGRGITKMSRKPYMMPLPDNHNQPSIENVYPISVTLPSGELSEVNMQLVVQNSVLSNEQIMQLQAENSGMQQ